MPCVKIVNERYDSSEAESNLIRYVYRKSLYIGGYSVDPAYAAEQMNLFRSYWNKNHGRRLYHFIVSLSDYESSHVRSVQSIAMQAYEICEYFSDEYQIVFGVHHNDRWHVHFLMNPVSYKTGKLYRGRRYDDASLAMAVEAAFGGRAVVVYD